MSQAPNVAYLQVPATIVNQAMDRIGQPGKIIGDITDGTPVAEAARRNYGQVLRQLLRTAHWDWARKQAALLLLGDATGQSPSYVSTSVEEPWTYAYAWPTDAVQGRWMPTQFPLTTQGTVSSPDGVPLTTGMTPVPPVPLLPARFLVASSDLYPTQIGEQPWQQPWNNRPDLSLTEGVGPINRKIILTDQQNALFVYTRLVTVIEEWDTLFREAMVMAMALVLLPTAIEDLKSRIATEDRIAPMLKNAIADARVANGNEAGMPQNTDHLPNWIRARNGGWGGSNLGPFGNGYAGLYLPWEPMSLGGNVY